VSRREAAQILALGRVELEDRPTAALAHALASLERADNEPARRFAVEALWHGAAAFVLPEVEQRVDFSPDGRWLAAGGLNSGVRLWSRDGGPSLTLGGPEGPPGVRFSPGGDFLAAGMRTTARSWSIPEGRELLNVELGGGKNFTRRGSHLYSITPTSERALAFRDWSVLEGVPDVFAIHDLRDVADWDIDGSGEWLVTALAQDVYATPLQDSSRDRSRLVGKHDAKVVWISSQTAGRIASGDETGEIRIWSFSGTSSELERTFQAPAPEARLDPTGSWVIISPGLAPTTSDIAYVWDLKGPPDAAPLALRNGDVNFQHELAIHPQGLWLVTADDTFGMLWPLHPRYSRVLRAQYQVLKVLFTADGKSLLSIAEDDTVRLWPLSPRRDEKHRVLMSTTSFGGDLAVDPAGKYALIGADDRVFVASLQGGERREMPGFRVGLGRGLVMLDQA